MNGVEFIKRIRKLARKQGLSVSIETRRGKGSHVMLFLGDRYTPVKDRKKELRAGLFHQMCKDLDVDPKEL